MSGPPRNGRGWTGDGSRVRACQSSNSASIASTDKCGGTFERIILLVDHQQLFCTFCTCGVDVQNVSKHPQVARNGKNYMGK